MESQYFSLAIWTAVFIFHGTVYGLQILHSPTDPGWTWASVVTGVICFVIAQEKYLAWLNMHEMLTVETRALALVVGACVYGVPMALCQILKQRKVNRKSEHINKTREFDK